MVIHRSTLSLVLAAAAAAAAVLPSAAAFVAVQPRVSLAAPNVPCTNKFHVPDRRWSGEGMRMTPIDADVLSPPPPPPPPPATDDSEGGIIVQPEELYTPVAAELLTADLPPPPRPGPPPPPLETQHQIPYEATQAWKPEQQTRRYAVPTAQATADLPPPTSPGLPPPLPPLETPQYQIPYEATTTTQQQQQRGAGRKYVPEPRRYAVPTAQATAPPSSAPSPPPVVSSDPRTTSYAVDVLATTASATNSDSTAATVPSGSYTLDLAPASSDGPEYDMTLTSTTTNGGGGGVPERYKIGLTPPASRGSWQFDDHDLRDPAQHELLATFGDTDTGEKMDRSTQDSSIEVDQESNVLYQSIFTGAFFIPLGVFAFSALNGMGLLNLDALPPAVDLGGTGGGETAPMAKVVVAPKAATPAPKPVASTTTPVPSVGAPEKPSAATKAEPAPPIDFAAIASGETRAAKKQAASVVVVEAEAVAVVAPPKVKAAPPAPAAPPIALLAPAATTSSEQAFDARAWLETQKDL